MFSRTGPPAPLTGDTAVAQTEAQLRAELDTPIRAFSVAEITCCEIASEEDLSGTENPPPPGTIYVAARNTLGVTNRDVNKKSQAGT